MGNTTWELRGDHATLEGAHLRFSLETKHPDRGLQVLQYEGRSASGLNVLQITPDPPTPPDGEIIDERYVRGDDLVVTYAQAGDRTSHPQVYWRPFEAGDHAAGVELILSIQTSLLNSSPEIRVLSEVPASEVLYYDALSGMFENLSVRGGSSWQCDAGTGLFLFRLTDGDTSYAELVCPADFHGAHVETDGIITRLSYRLFPTPLEKGVIRRGRVRALWMGRAGDERQAIACFESLVAAPPPLTT